MQRLPWGQCCQHLWVHAVMARKHQIRLGADSGQQHARCFMHMQTSCVHSVVCTCRPVQLLFAHAHPVGVLYIQTSGSAFNSDKASPASPPLPGLASCEGPPEPWLQHGHAQLSGMALPAMDQCKGSCMQTVRGLAAMCAASSMQRYCCKRKGSRPSKCHL